ncbi:hypothetical protein [Lysobacter humi (ex Lee et al. 2017)]
MKQHLLALALLIAPLHAIAADAPIDAAAMWKDFLGRTRYDDINRAYGALTEVGYGASGVTAEGCRTNATSLTDAVRKVPVSLALRHAAMLCAEVVGDAAGAEAHMQVLGALAAHAARDSGDVDWDVPIRVVRPEDVGVFLQLGGYERRYDYLPQLHASRYFPLVAVVFDKDAGLERRFAFDWVDTLTQLPDESDVEGFPYERELIARAYREAWVRSGDIEAVDHDALLNAWYEAEPAAKRDRLRAGAGRGGVLSARSWLQLCLQRPFPGCHDGWVDAVLPMAEAGHGIPRALLALAYLQGMGVPKDEKAARTLLDAADRTSADRTPIIEAASLLQQAGKSWPAWLSDRLESIADAGSRDARVLLIARAAADGRKPVLTAEDRRMLEAPENNRRGRGLAMLLAYGDSEDDARSALLERAAAAGSADAQASLGVERTQRDVRDAAALAMLQDAAHGGSDLAGRWLSHLAGLDKRWKDAEQWLLLPTVTGDVDARLLLADLYASGVEGFEDHLPKALETFEDLADVSPEARARLVRLLLDDERVPRDPRRARELLEPHARKGDTGSQLMLAGLMLDGSLGPGLDAAGHRWFETAVASGSADARNEYGLWLYNHRAADPATRARALGMLKEAEAKGSELARNNLAWVLCVSPFEDVFDGAAGLALARELGDPNELDPGTLDTVAACEAAAGNADAAVRLQERVLERVPATPDVAAMIERMKGRLADYRAGRRHTEQPGTDDD